MKVTDKDGHLIIYNNGEKVGRRLYNITTMRGLPLPKEENVLTGMLDEIKEHYNIEHVLGKYSLNPQTKTQKEALRNMSRMENLLTTSAFDDWVVSREVEIYSGLTEENAIPCLFDNLVLSVDFLLDNSGRKVPKGYLNEEVKLTLKDNPWAIRADVSPALPQMRSPAIERRVLFFKRYVPRKSKLEEILLENMMKEKVKIEK